MVTSHGRKSGASVRLVLWTILGFLIVGASSEAFARDSNRKAPGGVEVLQSGSGSIVLEYNLDDYSLKPVLVNGVTHYVAKVEGEPSIFEAEAPDLSSITRAITIPGDGKMVAHVVHTSHRDFFGIRIAPSKGAVSRKIDKRKVPYEFGPVYEQDAFFPAEEVAMGSPFIMRDVRGMVVDFHPFRYNPVTETLRVYDRIVVEIHTDGPGEKNVLKESPQHPDQSFQRLYKNHFINFEAEDGFGGNTPRPRVFTENGGMLIICHDPWLSNIEPLVNHKNKLTPPIPTTAVGVSTIGNNPASIAAYVQNAYDKDGISYVLLVGDRGEVASPGFGTENEDPSYGLVAGNDSIPDLLVGRFSANSADDVDTQVLRTIRYESAPATEQAWFKKGIGVASREGPGDDNEFDYVHLDNIRDDLLAYGYTQIDQIYETNGGDAQDVAAALNAGRGIINYTGHGDIHRWLTTGFDNWAVDSLTNDNMLPFAVSVACNNGEFGSGTCFAEAWLRATNGSEPTGAIGFYASTISMSWDPPMEAQDRFNSLLVQDAYVSFGALCFGGSIAMMNEYGEDGITEFKKWTVFGDPSVRVFGGTPSTDIDSDTDVDGDTDTDTDTDSDTDTDTDTDSDTDSDTDTDSDSHSDTDSSTDSNTDTGNYKGFRDDDGCDCATAGRKQISSLLSLISTLFSYSAIKGSR